MTSYWKDVDTQSLTNKDIYIDAWTTTCKCLKIHHTYEL